MFIASYNIVGSIFSKTLEGLRRPRGFRMESKIHETSNKCHVQGAICLRSEFIFRIQGFFAKVKKHQPGPHVYRSVLRGAFAPKRGMTSNIKPAGRKVVTRYL